MGVSLLTTYVADALNQLPLQFKNKERIQKLIEVLVERYQGLENAAFPLTTITSIDQSVGAQLDGIGRHLDESRNGQSDVDYRHALKVKIEILHASGTGNQLLSGLQNLFEPDFLQVVEYFPAGFGVFMSPIVDLNAVNRAVQSLKALAVEYYVAELNDNPFATSSLLVTDDSGTIAGNTTLTDTGVNFLTLGVQIGDEVNIYPTTPERRTVASIAATVLNVTSAFSASGSFNYDVRRNAPQPSGGYSSVAFPASGGKYVSLA